MHYVHCTCIVGMCLVTTVGSVHTNIIDTHIPARQEILKDHRFALAFWPSPQRTDILIPISEWYCFGLQTLLYAFQEGTAQTSYFGLCGSESSAQLSEHHGELDCHKHILSALLGPHLAVNRHIEWALFGNNGIFCTCMILNGWTFSLIHESRHMYHLGTREHWLLFMRSNSRLHISSMTSQPNVQHPMHNSHVPPFSHGRLWNRADTMFLS